MLGSSRFKYPYDSISNSKTSNVTLYHNAVIKLANNWNPSTLENEYRPYNYEKLNYSYDKYVEAFSPIHLNYLNLNTV